MPQAEVVLELERYVASSRYGATDGRSDGYEGLGGTRRGERERVSGV